MASFLGLTLIAVLLFVQGTDSQTVTVTLTGPSVVQQGNNSTFTCTVDNNGTATQFSWVDGFVSPTETIYSGGYRFAVNPKYSNFLLLRETMASSVMIIINTTVEDVGVYSCGIPQDNSDTINLLVEVRSRRSMMLTSTDENNEDKYIATCEATGGKPVETITWILDGVVQTDGNGNTIETTSAPTTSPLSNIRSMFTFPATLDNYGQTLVCDIGGHTLTELNGQISRKLNIHTSPCTAGTAVTVAYVTQGTGITVSCNASNQPTPIMRNYYIYSNGTLIHESADGSNEVLVQNPEAGTRYACLAGNYLGNTTLSEAVTNDPEKCSYNSESIPCSCSGLSSGASAGIAVLAALLVASVIINVIQFILLRRHETTPEFKKLPETVSSDGKQLSSKANDQVAYEMLQQGGDGAYTALKISPSAESGSSASSVIAPQNLTFFTRLGAIGRGDFGAVWKGVLRSDQGKVDIAIRQIPDQVTRSANVFQAVKVLSDLSDQQNVVKCLGYCHKQDITDAGSVLYEFIPGGTLLTHLRTTGLQSQPTYSNLKPNRARVDKDSLLNFAWQVAKGMRFLASKKIIHGTLCAHNVLLDERKECRLADYGLTSLFSKRDKATRWSSPETMVSGVHSAEGDIWSFGIVLWEIVTLGATPYPNMTFDVVQKEVTNGYKMPRPRHCGQELYTVMSPCWDEAANKRSSFDQIVTSLERILEETRDYLSLDEWDEGLYATSLDL